MNPYLSHPGHAALTSLEKGIPPLEGTLPIARVGEQEWSLLREDLPLPAALIRASALHHNSAWMQNFLSASGALHAPHGKTTMSPALFDLQLAQGAWAITVSTLQQIQVARAFGHRRIFLANQLIGRQAIDYVVRELAADPAFELMFLVDSAANVDALARAARAAGLIRPLEALVELGYPGGRTGCRTIEEALALARQVHASGGALTLRGIEGFEGLLKGPDSAGTLKRVSDFLDAMVTLARSCDSERLYGTGTVILSAGGSAFYDIVVEKLGLARLSAPAAVLVRAGCYITHDSILYVRAVDALRERNPSLAEMDGGLRPALEVWAYVQSRPEAEKLIAGLGKRDVSHDDKPLALAWFRPDAGMTAPMTLSADHVVTGLNDQHCHVSVPAASPLQVGDMIGFGISHPCLTFDKWRVLHVVDDDYRVTSSIRTYF